MDEKKSIKTYKRLFIVVSIILVGVLCLQGIYWVKQREQTANAVNMEQTADTANTEQTADTMNTGQEALPAESRCALSREGYTLQEAGSAGYTYSSRVVRMVLGSERSFTAGRQC